MNKRPLQITTALLALIPIATGILTMLGINDPLYASASLPKSPLLDSNLRFFGGIWLGLGLAMLWLIPSIERQSILFRFVWGAICRGGLGRLLSMVVLGSPPLPFVGFTVLEFIGAPLFIYWQQRVAHSLAEGRSAEL